MDKNYFLLVYLLGPKRHHTIHTCKENSALTGSHTSVAAACHAATLPRVNHSLAWA